MRPLARTAALLLGLAALAACASGGTKSRVAKAPDYDPNDPMSATLLMQQGQGMIGEGKFKDGMQKYREALKLQPANPVLHNLVGMALLQQGQGAQALDSFNRALQLEPNYADARNNRGAAYLQLGQMSMAEADFLSVLTDNTYANRAGVLVNLGSLYLTTGNLVAAEENLRMATRLNGPADAYYLLGRVEEKLGKKSLAESAYREAVTEAPERPDILLAFATFLQAEGRQDEARDLYRRVVAVAPNSPEAGLARTKLE